MGIEYSGIEIIDDLEELKFSLDSIDMEKVKRETVRISADKMSEKVRDAVIQDPTINTGGSGPYESGPGPSMGTKDAWEVISRGNSSFIVKPHPEVEQRAIVLNDGYPGKIEPTGDSPLRFTVYGTPMFAESVDGPEARNFWRAAFQKMQQNNEVEKIGKNQLQIEIASRI